MTRVDPILDAWAQLNPDVPLALPQPWSLGVGRPPDRTASTTHAPAAARTTRRLQRWQPQEVERLRREYAIWRDAGDLDGLAATFGLPRTSLENKAASLGLRGTRAIGGRIKALRNLRRRKLETGGAP